MLSWTDYNDYIGTNQQLYTRLCMSWSDSGEGSGSTNIRIIKGDNPTTIYSANFGTTWSGSGLVYHNCGSWQPTSTVSCSNTWEASCKIQVNHTQDKNVFIEHIFMEVAVK